MSSQKRDPMSLDLFEESPADTCSGAASGSLRKQLFQSRGTLEIGLTVTIIYYDTQNFSQDI